MSGRRYCCIPGGANSLLRLSVTDGRQRAQALEYHPLPDLRMQGPAGLKVALTDVHVRHGMLLLQPCNVRVLGGGVAALEGARRKTIEFMTLDVAEAKLRRLRAARGDDAPPPRDRKVVFHHDRVGGGGSSVRRSGADWRRRCGPELYRRRRRRRRGRMST